MEYFSTSWGSSNNRMEETGATSKKDSKDINPGASKPSHSDATEKTSFGTLSALNTHNPYNKIDRDYEDSSNAEMGTQVKKMSALNRYNPYNLIAGDSAVGNDAPPDQDDEASSNAEMGTQKHILRITVIQGRNLIEMDAASLTNEFTASSDPYAVVNVRGRGTRVKSQSKRTDFIRATLEPLWKTPLLFDLPSLEPSQLSGSTLDVEIFDHNDLTAPVPMGKVSLKLDEININPKLRGLGLTRSWYALRGTVTSNARGVVSSIADSKETNREIEELDNGVPSGNGPKSALGEIELMIDVVPDQIPHKPLAFNLGKLFRIIVPLIIYVLAFLIKTVAYAFVALFEGIAYYSIMLVAWLYTGVTIKLGRVALRFGGFGTGCPTELVVHDLKIPNPPGAYTQHPDILKLYELRITVNLRSIMAAILAKKRNKFSFPVLEIPLVHIHGLKLHLEKAPSSPYAKHPKDHLLNLWAILGGSPLDKIKDEIKEDEALQKNKKDAPSKENAQKKTESDDEEDDEDSFHRNDEKGIRWEDLTEAQKRKYQNGKKRCCGFPFRIKCNAILLHGVELHLGDLLADVMGANLGLTNPRPACIERLVLNEADLKHGKPFFLKKLIQEIVRHAELSRIVYDIAMQASQASGAEIGQLGGAFYEFFMSLTTFSSAASSLSSA